MAGRGCGSDPADQATGVDPTTVSFGGLGKEGSDGLLYALLPDNTTVDVTPRFTGVPFYTGYISTLGRYTLTHTCEADTPTNKDRLIIGVGEEVDLGGMPDGTNTTWSVSAGGLSATNGSGVTFTAPDRAATATVTVTVRNASQTISFDVIEPSGVIQVTNSLQHTVNRPDIGFHGTIYLTPDTVNFGAIECQEEQAYAVANGVYSQYNGTNHEDAPTPFPFTSTVVSGFGTLSYVMDQVYSGNPTNSPPFSPGTETVTIPWDFRVGENGDWKTNFTTLTHLCSLGPLGNLAASKAGAHWSCYVSDPSP